MNCDIVITGVGGQGNVLASRLLARAAMEAGLAVFTSEMIGMAQREGVVMSQVRMGRQPAGPLIPDGSADVLLGFEPSEAARALCKLKPGGVVITSSAPVVPVTAALGLCRYDAGAVLAYLRSAVPSLYAFDAPALAQRAGNAKTLNTVMLGALASLKLLPFSGEHLLRVLLDSLPESLRETNRRAFRLGYEILGVN
ncbi:pyruvate ferredoxin oxidoreductase [Desulfofundulus thermobenzoicus]|uniref:Pyruvate ferredoxin oxidoreductase n=1 Tax=Desulfofundulus thermobenzoicus TaxID=29376 RepID=A0A6N7IQH5_9FIRM|nr:indolepyruvate oxidoreductase subunit beta [Desulfofundulus thermobenzoicus]MQL52335.1 pyruvate ferredoxin oxidoreductase [Desulfofundulus thermobenzoicus]